MSKLEITVEEKIIDSDEIAFIKLKGDLDAKTSTKLENTLEDLIKIKKIYKWILDLEELGYISSAGSGILLVNFSRVHKKGGFIKLINVSKDIEYTFQLSGLAKIFEIDNTIK